MAATAFQRNLDVATLLAAVYQPHVVERSIREALKSRGVDDRRLLLTHGGFLPLPKGATINVAAIAGAQASASGKSKGLPDFAEDSETVSEVVREAEGRTEDTDE